MCANLSSRWASVGKDATFRVVREASVTTSIDDAEQAADSCFVSRVEAVHADHVCCIADCVLLSDVDFFAVSSVRKDDNVALVDAVCGAAQVCSKRSSAVVDVDVRDLEVIKANRDIARSSSASSNGELRTEASKEAGDHPFDVFALHWGLSCGGISGQLKLALVFGVRGKVQGLNIRHGDSLW